MSDRGTAVRLAVLATALVSLLALVALASRAGAPWSGTSGDAEGRSLALLGRLLLDVLLVAFTVALLAAFVVRMRRARLRPTRPADDVEDEDDMETSRFRRLVVRVAPYLLLVLIVFVVFLFAREVDRRLPRDDPPPETGAAQTGAPESPALEAARDAADWVLVAAGGLLLLALAIGTAAPLAQRRLGARRADEEAQVAGLSRVLDQSLDDLLAEPDPRRAVIAAYARMECGLAARGLGRHACEAPLEYMARLLTDVTEDRESVGRLTTLFERAKFSPHPVVPAAKAEAIDCLVAIRGGLT